MLRRASIASVIALVAALLGFTGLLQSTAPIAQTVFYAMSAFIILSLMFSLFEPAEQMEANTLHSTDVDR